MLHYRIHPPLVDMPKESVIHIHSDTSAHKHSEMALPAKRFDFSHGLASIFSLIDIILVTLLFCWRKTVIYGFLLKGLFAIFAVVLMGHFSIADLINKNPTYADWILRSTLADILVALAGFLIAKAIYNSYFKLA